MRKITREDALAYHTGKRHGKTEVVATWGSRSGTVTVDLVDGETTRVTIIAE